MTFSAYIFIGWLYISFPVSKATINGRNAGADFLETDTCRQISKTQCEPLRVPTCFGVQLPYTHTSTQLVKVNASQFELQRNLTRWEGLRFSPKCWVVIQPLLCSVYMPKCQDGIIELPSQETCKSTRSTCKFVEQDLPGGWPDFLKCDDLTRFPNNCKNTEIRELKFNTSTECMDPMIQVENTSTTSLFEGFEGCALKCQDPLFTGEEHELMSRLTFYVGLCLLIFNGWVIATFSISDDHSFESKSVKYANWCYLIGTAGYMSRFLPNSKGDIVCRKDGTVARGGLSEDESFFCLSVFILLYAGTVSALQWLIVFSYNFNRKCKPADSGKRIRRHVPKKYKILMCVFSIAAVFFAVHFGEVGGSSITGTCFLGTNRIWLLLIPVETLSCGIIYLLCDSAYSLHKLTSGNIISTEWRKELQWIIFRIISFVLILTGIAVCLLGVNIYQVTSMGRRLMEKSLRESIVCRMNLTETTEYTECNIKLRPTLIPVVLSILLYFCGGMLISSWAWTSASWRIWIRFLSCCYSSDELQTTTVIRRRGLGARTFRNRKQLGNGRPERNVLIPNEDPVGLDRLLDPAFMERGCTVGDQESRVSFQANTDGTGDVSNSDYHAVTPNFVSRRGGLIPPHSSVSCQSEDSRQQCDSAVALNNLASEQLQGSNSTLDQCSSKRLRSNRRWFQMGKLSRKGKSWRPEYGGSSTSVESNGGSKILPAITAMIDQKLGGPGGSAQPNNQLLPLKRAIIVKELAIQTSIEKLSVLSPLKHNLNAPNNNLTTCDKSTQSSTQNLRELGTQTKKSAIKKKDKGRGQKSKDQDVDIESGKNNLDGQPNDPVFKLLSPD